MRTHFKQRAAEAMPELLPDYEPSVGAIYKIIAAEHGNTASDPKKVADIVVNLANAEDVPKRLILGKDSEPFVKQIETARAEEAAKYVELTRSTVFSDAPDQE